MSTKRSAAKAAETTLHVSTRQCTKCTLEKPATAFKRRSDRNGSLRSQCRQCDTERERARRKTNPQSARAASTRWHEKNKLRNPPRKSRVATFRAVAYTPLGEWIVKALHSQNRRAHRKELDAQWLDKWQHVTHCPVSGLPFRVGAKDGNGNPHPQSASLDRIDPSKGYTPDNTRVVSYFVNVAKNAWSQEAFEFLILAVASNLRH
jgi:hypothetical protein